MQEKLDISRGWQNVMRKGMKEKVLQSSDETRRGLDTLDLVLNT